MRRNPNKAKKDSANGIIPNSFRFISSCIKTVSSNVRSAGASVTGSFSADSDLKDQVLWASFDSLELGPSSVKRVLLLGYSNGFQVLEVEDASAVGELASRRDDPVTFLQMQPIPEKTRGREGFRMAHPLLLVVASDESRSSGPLPLETDGVMEPHMDNSIHSPTAVRFYSLRSHSYVHVLRFRSPVLMVRCSPRIVAVGLSAQIYCFDALTLENRFSVLTYPTPQSGSQGFSGINIGYGPMAVGPRWLAYASNNPMSNTGRLSPQSLSPSPGVSPSSSPGSGSLVARYAMESSKHLASGIINLGDMSYKTLSKYCHELLPDGPSHPVSNSSWKVGRVAPQSTETDAAGTVVIKDFQSRAIVSQFRAHASPLSALCFDPSGTLLVTASINGNNINIFRILPSSSQNGSGTRNYDWSSSYVHLYKLHRGMTSAVIQDICFSHYSQWIAIVSSRGTCHIFAVSPFGGETSLQVQNNRISRPTLVQYMSVPWWSTSSFKINQPFSPPSPAPVTLSVVSRIKNVNFGWLNTVTNATSSGTGKVSVPSGVLAAAFHNSIRSTKQPAPTDINILEHLMVYTPSGYVIQYELLPSVGLEQGESSLRNGTTPLVQIQEEELRVKVEPIQWWDACRRADWPEVEECVGGEYSVENVMDTSDNEESDVGEKGLVKHNERSHWHLSKAEVQIRSGRIPIWQKSKIYFFVFAPLESEDPNTRKEFDTGEIDIENIPVREVEFKRKDLLPVFEHFSRVHSDSTDGRGSGAGMYPGSTSSSDGSNEMCSEDTVAPHAKMVSCCINDQCHDGSSRMLAAIENLRHMETVKSNPVIPPTGNGNDGIKRPSFILEESPPLNHGSSFTGLHNNLSSELSATAMSSPNTNGINAPSSYSAIGTFARAGQSLDSIVKSEAPRIATNCFDSSKKNADEGQVHEDMHDLVDFGQFCQEGYCKAMTHDNCSEITGVVTDADSSNSPCDKEKSASDVDNDDMLGGVFDFSEEGLEY